MTPSLRPRAIRSVLAGLTAGTLLLTACGNDSVEPTNKTADQLLADAVDTTLGLQSFAIDSRYQLTTGTDENVATIAGAIDYTSMVFDTKMTHTSNGSPGSVIQLRGDGSKLWIKFTGEPTLELPEGLEWVEGDTGQIDDSDSFRFRPVGVLSPVILLKASGGAVEIGGEDNLTQFTTTVDYEAAVAAAGPLAADLQRGFHATAREPVVLNIHAWLDDDGVVRKMDFTHESEDLDATYAYTFNLSAVNEPVKAPEPPDESTVFSGPEANALFDQILSAQ
jgi:hypothetical protein